MTHICIMRSRKPIRIYMGGLILGVNTLYRLFCFFQLFSMVGKGLILTTTPSIQRLFQHQSGTNASDQGNDIREVDRESIMRGRQEGRDRYDGTSPTYESFRTNSTFTQTNYTQQFQSTTTAYSYQVHKQSHFYILLPVITHQLYKLLHNTHTDRLRSFSSSYVPSPQGQYRHARVARLQTCFSTFSSKLTCIDIPAYYIQGLNTHTHTHPESKTTCCFQTNHLRLLSHNAKTRHREQ